MGRPFSDKTEDGRIRAAILAMLATSEPTNAARIAEVVGSTASRVGRCLMQLESLGKVVEIKQKSAVHKTMPNLWRLA